MIKNCILEAVHDKKIFLLGKFSTIKSKNINNIIASIFNKAFAHL